MKLASSPSPMLPNSCSCEPRVFPFWLYCFCCMPSCLSHLNPSTGHLLVGAGATRKSPVGPAANKLAPLTPKPSPLLGSQGSFPTDFHPQVSTICFLLTPSFLFFAFSAWKRIYFQPQGEDFHLQSMDRHS